MAMWWQSVAFVNIPILLQYVKTKFRSSDFYKISHTRIQVKSTTSILLTLDLGKDHLLESSKKKITFRTNYEFKRHIGILVLTP